MRYAPFGFSNIAWPSDSLDEALALLADLGCAAVEIAPFSVFGRWQNIDEEAKRLRDAIERRRLVCSALQGILYGVDDIALFGSDQSRSFFESHMGRVAGLADLLGAKACVFGAPKQRDPGDLPMREAWDIAVTTLRKLGPVFAARDCALAIEANARRYGCRFVTTTAEAVRLVAEVDTRGIALQIDTGTILLEAEPPEVLHLAAPLAVHAHVSDVDLQPPGSAGHSSIATALRDSGYAGSLSVEMRHIEAWRTVIPAAATFVRAAYR